VKVLIIGKGRMGEVLYNELIAANHSVRIQSKFMDQIEEAFDVLIDFSHPDNLEGMIGYCRTSKTPAVIATTGYSDEQFQQMKKLSEEIPVLYSGNYSLGVVLMERLVREAAKVLGEGFDIEVIEKHHHHKIDAPSGTAKMMVEAANEQLGYKVIYGRAGMCKRDTKEIAVHTVRGGSIVGEHEVLFAGVDEVLSIKHEALSKQIFAKGALKGAKWLLDKEAGLYNMEDVLFGS